MLEKYNSDSHECLNVLCIGDFRFSFYEEEFCDALSSRPRVNLVKFKVSGYFNNYSYRNLLEKMFLASQNRYKIGPVVSKINRDIVSIIKKHQFDLVFVWRGIHLYTSTLYAIKRSGAALFGYNNDNTFANSHPWWLFRNLKKQIGIYDFFYSYRLEDMNKIIELGVDSKLFLPTVDSKRIYPISDRRAKYDVVFIGHFENDGRDEMLLALSNLGINVGLFGQHWSNSKRYADLVKSFGEIEPAYEKYNEILNQATIGLNLLSSQNKDEYTRRSFEIPAARVPMLAKRTSGHLQFFRPDVDAVFYDNYEQIPTLVLSLLDQPERLELIANNGYQKVKYGSFSMMDRVDMLIRDYWELA